MLIDMLVIPWIIIAGFLVHNYNSHYVATKDTSIQGFIEYLKDKYYYKK